MMNNWPKDFTFMNCILLDKKTGNLLHDGLLLHRGTNMRVNWHLACCNILMPIFNILFVPGVGVKFSSESKKFCKLTRRQHQSV